ncbi:MAG: Gfo/Idh/MocA family oxidoreductase [Candidatus Sungbacteria bacterium]|nr:Gfo/Idh/MocA family oxidoreductase [Candidatus Sungbacteria bacterium]
MKFLIVGTGSIGRRHYKNLLALGYRDVAVVRSRRRMDQPQRQFFAEYHPRVFFDVKAAFTEQPDAVFVCNPTSLHVSTGFRAVKAGSHVFIEKPISHTSAGVGELLREAARRKRIVYVGYNFRHHPLLKKAKKLLDSGKLGRLHSARFATGEYLPGWHPWEDHRKAYAGRSDLGGGVVLTQSHDLDLIHWFFGPAKAASAIVQNSGALGINTDDNAVLVFSAERCPVVVSSLDYLSRPAFKRFVIIGSTGSMEWDYYENTLRITEANGKARVIRAPEGFERNRMYLAELKDFIHCVRRGVNPESDGKSGRAVLEMALAAKKMAKIKLS